MSSLTLIWILIVIVTGARLSEHELVLSAKKKYVVRQSLLFRSLMLGSLAWLATCAVLAAVGALSFVVARDAVLDIYLKANPLIEHWVLGDMEDAVLVGGTLSALVSFLVAPPVAAYIRRRLRLRRWPDDREVTHRR